MKKFVLILVILSVMCIENSPIKRTVIVPPPVSAKINEMNEIMREIDHKVYEYTEVSAMEDALFKVEGLKGKYLEIFSTLFGEEPVTMEYLYYCENWRKQGIFSNFRSLTEIVPKQTAVIVAPYMMEMPFHNYSSYISALEKFERYTSALLDTDISGIEHINRKLGLILDLMNDGIKVGMDHRTGAFLSDNYSDNVTRLFSYPPEILNSTIGTLLTSDIKKLSEDLTLLIPELNGSVKNEMQQYLYDFEACDLLTCTSKMRDIHFMLTTASDIFDGWLGELRNEYKERFGIVLAVNSEFRGEINPLLGK